MKKSDLIRLVSEQTNYEIETVHQVTNAIIENIAKALTNKHDMVTLRGLGTFFVKKRAARVARNFKDNTPLITEETFFVKFKPGMHLKQDVKSRLEKDA